VAPVVGHVEGHHHEVTEAHGDFLEAARAHVGLARLEGVDEGNLEVVVVAYRGIAAHNTNRTTTRTAAATNR
jgi:hypothetical protein